MRDNLLAAFVKIENLLRFTNTAIENSNEIEKDDLISIRHCLIDILNNLREEVKDIK